MHLLVEVIDEPECMPSPCILWRPRIVEYILPRPDYCGSEPYSGDPWEVVWYPGQDNVETEFQVGDIVEV
jgi:hypothetical protein